MKKIHKRRLGSHAEDIAVRFLKRKGYRIIERNFYCRFGEIDIVAKDGDELVFVEVRSGSDYRFADPLESIHGMKIKRLKKLVLGWLNLRQIQECNIRLDTVVIVFREKSEENILERFFLRNRHIEIRHIRGIF